MGMNLHETPSIGLVLKGFDKGGLEQVVYNLYVGYRKQGWKAYIFVETDNMGYFAERLESPDHLCMFSGNKDRFLQFCYINRITHLHYHYSTFFVEEANKYGIRTIYTIHNTYVWMADDTIRHYGTVLAQMNAIVAVSSRVKNYFCSKAKIPLNDVEVIVNGIDFTELECTELPETLKRKSFAKDDDITLCMSASILPAKNQIGMIGVMKLVTEKMPNVKLIIVGNVGDQKYYDMLKSSIIEHKMGDNIILVNYFDHRYMGEFLRQCVDIFILPTLYEGCSNAVLEAAYCAKPILVTDVGNARDMVGCAAVKVVPPAYDSLEKVTLQDIEHIATMIEPTNTQKVADGILEIADNLLQWKQRAAEYTLNRDQFNVERMVRQYVELIKEI